VDVAFVASSHRVYALLACRALAEKQASGVQQALALASDPEKILSTIQTGITLVGVLSGAFSGATLGQRVTEWLVNATCRCCDILQEAGCGTGSNNGTAA
jgi:CBS domain containing-hemolysin-like protein